MTRLAYPVLSLMYLTPQAEGTVYLYQYIGLMVSAWNLLITLISCFWLTLLENWRKQISNEQT